MQACGREPLRLGRSGSGSQGLIGGIAEGFLEVGEFAGGSGPSPGVLGHPAADEDSERGRSDFGWKALGVARGEEFFCVVQPTLTCEPNSA